MVAHHVEQRIATHDGLEQFGTLREGRAGQQSAIASAHDSELRRLGVAALDKPFRCGHEVVENVLLFREHAGPVPFLAELTAAAQAG